MNVDPRFNLSVEERGGQRVLLFRASREIVLAEAATGIAGAGIDELLELAGASAAAREELRAAASGPSPSATVLVHGWQSWSFAGELAGRERVGRSVLPLLNLYVDGPAPLPRRGELVSYFLTVVRSGGHRLVLASFGQAEGSAGGAMPPIAFRIDRGGAEIRVEALAEGGRFAAGAPVAAIGLSCREGYFAAKDVLATVFRGGPDAGRFERLAFLGHDGSLVPGGYESWYNRYTKIDEAGISRDFEALDANGNLINEYYLKRGKPTVFQVDDGWERAIGDWEPDPVKFPHGMSGIASRAEDKGMIPGLWLAPFLVTRESAAFRERPEWILRDGAGRPVRAGWNPGWDGAFHCLDLSIPEVEDYLAVLFDRVVDEWGYRYLKLDFLYAAFLGGARARSGAAYEHYDRVVGRITSKLRDPRGRPIAWLGCGAPLEPSIRHFPLMRIGADTKEDWDWGALKPFLHAGRPSAYVNLTHTIGRAMLDGTVFVNDPDVVFCRESRMRLTEVEKELVGAVDRMLASQIMFSDDASEFGDEAGFTERLVALFDRLGEREFGAERLGRDLYRLFSRDGRVWGWVNLGDSAARVSGVDAEAAAAAERILFHGRFAGAGLELERRSVSLFAR
jgi:alpha-galactosidase